MGLLGFLVVILQLSYLHIVHGFGRNNNHGHHTSLGPWIDLDNNRFLILQVQYSRKVILFGNFNFLFYLFLFFLVCYQGEVEQISLMKPKAQGPHDEGFLEYLEDIIGTNKYVEKIDESSKE